MEVGEESSLPWGSNIPALLIEMCGQHCFQSYIGMLVLDSVSHKGGDCLLLQCPETAWHGAVYYYYY